MQRSASLALLLLSLAIAAVASASAFIPSPTSQPAVAAATTTTRTRSGSSGSGGGPSLVMSSASVPKPSANPPVPNQGAAARSSIFPPPKMSFYGEQRRRLQEQEQEAQMQWANSFNALLVEQGQDLCVRGYEGFLRTGSKGAVACYFEDDGTPIGQAPLNYTTLEELLADERMDEEVKGQLTERVMSYDPEKEVAILFAYRGQVGLNVIRPTYPPKYIFEMLTKK